jgi:endonuclease III
MKNATKYAEELRHLYKRLLKEHKPGALEPLEPLEALVRGAMSYDVSDNRAEDAMKAIGREFVDLNELRVATDLEIQELLGVKYPEIEHRVGMITQCLNMIFEKEHTLSLDRLKSVSKRDARQFLRDLPEIHPFVEGYVMLYALDGHAMPMDAEITAYLKEQEVIEEESTVEE